MDALEKFKKHAQTVLLWIEDEKPRVQRFSCPKEDNPKAGKLSSICRVNTEV